MLNTFKKIVIGDNAPKFEESVFLFISFMSGLFSLIFIIPLNFIQKYPLFHSFFVIVFILFSFIFWFIARFKRIFLIFSFILTVNMSLAFIYVYNAGIKGSIPYFLCQIFLFTIILLRGNKRRIMVLIQIISLMILFSIDIIKPDIPYINESGVFISSTLQFHLLAKQFYFLHLLFSFVRHLQFQVWHLPQNVRYQAFS